MKTILQNTVITSLRALPTIAQWVDSLVMMEKTMYFSFLLPNSGECERTHCSMLFLKAKSIFRENDMNRLTPKYEKCLPWLIECFA